MLATGWRHRRCSSRSSPRLRLYARDGWWELVGAATGLLGGGLGIVTALLAIAGRGTEHPYDARVSFALAALALASLALAGGALLHSRPRPAIGMLFAGSTAGCVAMSLFTIDTWCFVALPLCRLAAAIAVARAAASAGASRGTALRRRALGCKHELAYPGEGA